jgi:hypothetical protein
MLKEMSSANVQKKTTKCFIFQSQYLAAGFMKKVPLATAFDTDIQATRFRQKYTEKYAALFASD